MNEGIFIPSCNIHARGFACISKDKIVYAARNNIAFLKCLEGEYSLQFIECAHDKKVEVVVGAPASSSSEIQKLFVSGGCDGYVRLWDSETLTAKKAHCSHLSKRIPNAVVTNLSWSEADPNLIASIGSNDIIVIWYLAENVTKKISFKTKPLTSIACSPCDSSLIALGDIGGIVMIIRIGKPKNYSVIRKIRAVETEIVDLAWQPTPLDALLAVTSAKGELALWGSSSGRCKKKMKLFRKVSYHDKQTIDLPHPILWKDSETLLTRQANSIVAIKVANAISVENWREECRTVHEVHRRDFFTIAIKDNMVWSMGLDRQLLGYDLVEEKLLHGIGVLIGNGICAAVSPYDANRVVFGGADGCVRPWTISECTASAYILHKSIKDRVMSICWHPLKENIIVFGTSAGRVGLLDVQGGKPTTILVPVGNKDVYWLTFGPRFFNPDSKTLALYAISNYSLFVYDDTVPDIAPKKLSEEMNLQCNKITDVAWKPDYSILGLGLLDGGIALFRANNLTPLLVIPAYSGLVQFLTWHPQMTSSDTELSPYHNLLTAASRDPSGEIRVFKIVDEKETVTYRSAATLRGHHGHVHSVCWSPHIGGHLLSAGSEPSLQIWNAVTETPLMNLDISLGSPYTFAMWSPVDSDFIYSGSMDSTVRISKISSKKWTTLPPLPAPIIKKPRKNKGKSMHECDLAVEEPLEPKIKERDNVPLAKTTCSSLKLPPSILSRVWPKTEASTCISLLQATNEDRSSLFNTPVFASDDVLTDKLDNLKNHALASKDFQTSLSLWQGQLKELLKQSIADGKVTVEMVALAPSVSPRLWLEACQALARQLRAQMKFVESANYFIASQMIETAVETLLEGGYCLEAISVVRNHLGDEKELLNDSIVQYAKQLELQKRIQEAVECYIYLEHYADALRVLSSTDDASSLLAAGLAAEKAECDEELKCSLALRAFSACVTSDSLDLAHQVQQCYPELESLQVLHTVYTLLIESSDEQIPLLDVIKESLVLKAPTEAYLQIQKIVRNRPSNANSSSGFCHWKTWTVVQELSLAYCSEDETTMMRHVLRAVNARYEQSGISLFSLCRRLNPSYSDSGLFKAEGGLGSSLRAFLCLGLLERAEAAPDDASSIFPHIARLQPDLLHDSSFRYHRARVQLNSCEKALSSKALNKQVANEVASNGEGTELADTENLIEKVDNLADEVGDLSVDSNAKDVSSEISEELKELIERRKNLVAEIEAILTEREVVANPILGFFKLRNLCESLGRSDDEARNLGKLVEERVLPLTC